MVWIICYLCTLTLLAAITGFAAVSAICAEERTGNQEFDAFREQDERLIKGHLPSVDRVRIFFRLFFAALTTPRIGVYAAIGGTIIWGITKLF